MLDSHHLDTWNTAIIAAQLDLPFEDALTGWPEALMIWQVAKLQRFDRSYAEQLALHRMLCQATERMELPIHSHRLVTFKYSGIKDDLLGNPYGEPLPESIYRDENTPLLCADDFAPWLKRIGEPPSPHITAWLAATTPAAGYLSPEAQLLAEWEAEAAIQERGSFERLANRYGLDLASVKEQIATARQKRDTAAIAPAPEETAAQRRARWLAEWEAEAKIQERGAYARLAARHGVDPSNMRNAIIRAREERTSTTREGGMFSQLVRSGQTVR